MSWDARLIEAGVEIAPVDAHHVRLRHQGEEVVLRLVRTTRRLHPSAVADPPEPSALLVAPAASSSAAHRARAAGWSLATDDGPIGIRFSDRHVLELAQQPQRPSPQVARPGRQPRGTMAVVRRLLLHAPDSQTHIGRAVGVSQARVSQIFDLLQGADLVRRTRNGWLPADWEALCDWWLTHYPGPGGVTTWWSGLSSVVAQSAAAVDVLRPIATPVVSGDVAADLVAPWRQPALAVVYADHGCDLTEAGLARLPSSEGATLALTVPEDHSVWPAQSSTRSWNDTEMALADGLQILYDLGHSPGPDAAEAAASWRAHLRDMGPDTTEVS